MKKGHNINQEISPDYKSINNEQQHLMLEALRMMNRLKTIRDTPSNGSYRKLQDWLEEFDVFIAKNDDIWRRIKQISNVSSPDFDR